MMGAAARDAENNVISIDINVLLRCNKLLAKSNVPVADKAIRLLASCYRSKQHTGSQTEARKRHLEATVGHRRDKDSGPAANKRSEETDDPMMSAAARDVENNVISIDTNIINVILQCIKLLDKSNSPIADQVIRLLASCFHSRQNSGSLTEARKRPLEATVLHRRDKDSDPAANKRSEETGDVRRVRHEGNGGKKRACEDNTEWQCQDCDEGFRSKSCLDRHINNAHSVKRRRLMQHEENVCEDYDSVFTTEIASRNHENNDSSSSEVLISPKSKCYFCGKVRSNIDKHYKSVHKIIHPKQILFYNGEVLVPSDIDTEGGKAPWFIREKHNFNKREVTCRLCIYKTNLYNIDMLEKHHTVYHIVDSSALYRLNFLFRAKEGSHLGLSASQLNPRHSNVSTPTSEHAGKNKLPDLPASQTASKYEHRVQSSTPQSNYSNSETEIKNNAAASSAERKKKKLMTQIEKKAVNDLIMYQCEECEVTKTTYDAAVDHAQLHHLEEYRPRRETCGICKFAFEAQCFADHSNCDHDTERKILRFNPSNLLNDEWFTIFQGLSETLANQIKSSSIYKYTRAVKLNSDEVSGIPLYQCEMCELHVYPEEVEDHCNNKNTCVKNKSQNHYCSICDIFFYTFVAITEHSKEHNNGTRINSFRKIKFNRRQDDTINRALQKLSSKSCSPEQASPFDESVLRPIEEVPVGTEWENSQPIEIDDGVVTTVFCGKCNKSIMYSYFEAHADKHKSYQNDSIENETSQIIENVEENSQPIEIDDAVVTTVFCGQCDKSIVYSHFEAHADKHKSYQNDSIENDSSQIIENVEENCVDSHNHECVNSKDVAPQNEAAVILQSKKGTMEQWNSYNDSCLSFEYNSCDVQAEVHAQKEFKEALQSNNKKLIDKNNKSDNKVEDLTDHATEIGNNKSGKTTVSEERNIQGQTTKSFSKEMENDFISYSQNLFQEIESYIPSDDKNLTTQNLVNILEDNATKLGNPTGNNETYECSLIHNKKEERNHNIDKLTAANENGANSQDMIAENQNNTDPKRRHGHLPTTLPTKFLDEIGRLGCYPCRTSVLVRPE